MQVTLQSEQVWDFVELKPHVDSKKHKLFTREIVWQSRLIL